MKIIKFYKTITKILSSAIYFILFRYVYTLQSHLPYIHQSRNINEKLNITSMTHNNMIIMY